MQKPFMNLTLFSILFSFNFGCVSGIGEWISEDSAEALAILNFEGSSMGPSFMRHRVTKIPRKQPLALDPATIKLGQGLYDKYCLQCHGSSGTGDGPYAQKKGLNPVNLLELSSELTKNQFIFEVKSGNEQMPDWSSILSDKQIDAISSYIIYLSKLK